jgi:hypothetical protein
LRALESPATPLQLTAHFRGAQESIPASQVGMVWWVR